MLNTSNVSLLLPYIARFSLCAVFALAAVEKLVSTERFERAISGYGLLPAGLIRPVARVLPWIEMASALCVGIGVALVPAALLVAGLLAVFGLAMSISLVRGLSHDCGCGVAGTSKISWWSVGRNALLIGLAAIIVARPPSALTLWPLTARPHDDFGDPLAALIISTSVVFALSGGYVAVTVMRRSATFQILLRQRGWMP